MSDRKSLQLLEKLKINFIEKPREIDTFLVECEIKLITNSLADVYRKLFKQIHFQNKIISDTKPLANKKIVNN